MRVSIIAGHFLFLPPLCRDWNCSSLSTKSPWVKKWHAVFSWLSLTCLNGNLIPQPGILQTNGFCSKWTAFMCWLRFDLFENVWRQSLKVHFTRSEETPTSCVHRCRLMFFLSCLVPHISQVICRWQDWRWAFKHWSLVKYFIQPGSAQNTSSASNLTWESSCLRNFDEYLNVLPHPASGQTNCFWTSMSLEADSWNSLTCLFRLPWKANLWWQLGHSKSFPSCWSRWRDKWSFLR